MNVVRWGPRKQERESGREIILYGIVELNINTTLARSNLFAESYLRQAGQWVPGTFSLNLSNLEGRGSIYDKDKYKKRVSNRKKKRKRERHKRILGLN